MTLMGTVPAQQERQEPRPTVGAGVVGQWSQGRGDLSKQTLSICCVKEMTRKEWKLKGNLEAN